MVISEVFFSINIAIAIVIFHWKIYKLLCLCARLFIYALSSPAGKGLNSWFSFVVSNCEFFTFPLVSWVRCGTWLIVSIPDLCTLTYIDYQSCFVCAAWSPALSFNAHIIPILKIVCTIFHYSCPWISSMSWSAFKITRWPIFIPRFITSAFYIPVDLY